MVLKILSATHTIHFSIIYLALDKIVVAIIYYYMIPFDVIMIVNTSKLDAHATVWITSVLKEFP